MARRSKSSRRWLDEHEHDDYVRRARAGGWRSRAVFKLDEIQQRDRILRPGMSVVDLGAAPGGWSQYAGRQTGRGGRVIAVDLLDMEPIDGVTFIRGDFREDDTLAALRAALGDSRADLVMSDMAPNISGIRGVDQPHAMHLAELSLALAAEVLNDGGALLVKVFQGEGFDPFLRAARAAFGKVVIRKPKASRARSREIYLLARNYRMV